MTPQRSAADGAPAGSGPAPAAPSPAASSPAAPSLGRRIARRAGRLTLSTGLAAAAGVAAVLGAQALQERNAPDLAPHAASAPTTAPVVTVARADGLRVETRRLGVVEPARRIQAAFDLAGTVETVAVQEGDRVQAGQLLARLDAARIRARIAELEAQRAAQEAQAELARRTLERQAALRDRGFASDQRWDEARLEADRIAAALRQSDAGLRAARIDLDHSELRAPFAGEIAARSADEGAVVSAGQPILELIEADRPQVRVGLPADAAARLEPGTLMTVEIDGRRLTAAVAAVRPDVDPATRTRAALLDLLAPPEFPVAFGAAVSVILERTRDESGFWLPVAALREGGKGLWTVLTVEERPGGAVAGVESVELLHVEGERAFVRGSLAPGDRVVAAGAHKLAPGLRLDAAEIPLSEALGEDAPATLASAD
ncbi:efflux RND transporter periplasmic adaptor subunit [Albimonas sp. CAU 1670]|uniref:efflux RND transporter periplasmic adaptor subunit n=1 Tax=Albimonas sp. CAU 1670 TaxID=3032599 RepID=UPI0023DCCE47|nr:efflux RND transporter periplasmic adaptor subunit [Albimonas sp. CAU 1670]MDF2234884.1 efflux RND transporter periplasmic adaptor subunit [Albimonas sp. CAU 1670]